MRFVSSFKHAAAMVSGIALAAIICVPTASADTLGYCIQNATG